MGVMSEFDQQLDEIRQVMRDDYNRSMSEEPLSVQVEYRADSIIRELRDLPLQDRLACLIMAMDELCAVAKEHSSEIDRYVAGQIITRTQLAASLLLERAPVTNKLVYLR